MDQVTTKLPTWNNPVQSLFFIMITFYTVIPERVPFVIHCSLLLTNSLWKFVSKLGWRPVNTTNTLTHQKIRWEGKSCLSGLYSFQPFCSLLTILKLSPKPPYYPKGHSLNLENLVDKGSTYRTSTFYSLVTPLAIFGDREKVRVQI